MSFRTYINDNEWLGNNILPNVIKEELIKQGCKFDDDGLVYDKFEVKDLNGLVKATEQYIKEECEYNSKVADFNGTIKDCPNMTLDLFELKEYAIIFASVNLLNYVGEEFKDWTINFKKDGRVTYKLLKKGKCVFEFF